MELAGKNALITGGNKGIGRACALALSAAGAQVIVAARNITQVDSVVAEIKEKGGKAAGFALDVKSTENVNALFAQVDKDLGGCDILVNNAGIAGSAPILKCSEEHLAELMDVNLTGTFRCIKAALPNMLSKGWGRIINMASIAGKSGAPYISAYTSSKHAVIGLTRAVAQEVATKGITVNAICPGYVETEMGEQAILTIMEKTKASREAAYGMIAQMSPQRRLFQPEEVAFLVVTLAAPLAAGINGQAINICGGLLPY